jgi:hypothetical protein
MNVPRYIESVIDRAADVRSHVAALVMPSHEVRQYEVAANRKFNRDCWRGTNLPIFGNGERLTLRLSY